MGKVDPLASTLTISRRFVEDFFDEEGPCFALSMIEDRGQLYAALALQPGEALPADVSADGFEFGHSVLGGADFEVIHFAFEFHGFETFNVVLNPRNAQVQAVMRSMIDQGGYFILVAEPDHQVTAFRADCSKQDLHGLREHYPRLQRSRTTGAQYRRAETFFRQRPLPPGPVLNWVCRDDERYLEPATDPWEMAPRAIDEPEPERDAELGQVVLDGHVKPPRGDSSSEAFPAREVRAIAQVLAARLEDLERADVEPAKWPGRMAPQVALFRRLLELARADEMASLLSEFPALYRYARLLERLVAVRRL